jgi:hypothetical protein
MEKQDDNHCAGPVGMQATKKRPSRNRFCDVSDRGVRVIGGGHVVKRKEYAGDHLRNENEQESRAEYVSEPSAAGNGFIESGPKQIIQARSTVEPSP